MKLNIGCGNQKNETWIGINKISGVYTKVLDLNIIEKLPFENNSVEVIFMGHIIEHLTDEVNHKIFKEIFRILKPSGLLRIVTPDFDIFLNEYNNDSYELYKSWKSAKGKPIIRGSNKAEKFVNVFISWAVSIRKKLKKRNVCFDLIEFDLKLQNEFNNLTEQEDKENFISWIKTFIPVKENILLLHINAFNFLRIKKFLEEAGFITIVKSEYRESKYEELNKLAWDKLPKKSVFVESIK